MMGLNLHGVVDQFGAAKYKNPQSKAPWSNGAVPVNRSRLNSPSGNLAKRRHKSQGSLFKPRLARKKN